MEWSVDLRRRTATHASGLSVELLKGEVIDIVKLPKGLRTRELPKLLEAAAAAYAAELHRTRG